MRARLLTLTTLLILSLTVHSEQIPKLLPFATHRADRIAQIEKMLPKEPTGLGRPIDDRKAWESIGRQMGRDTIIADAERTMSSPMIPWSDSLYLEFYKSGLRPPGEAMMGGRHARLTPLVVGECVENRGRFLPAIEATIIELLSDPSWMRSAHDWNANAFYGRHNEVDLPVAGYSHAIAQAFYLLGDRLPDTLRNRAIEVLRAKMFDPMQIAITKGNNNTAAWLVNTNNWNAVCLAGVTGTALAILPSRAERALYVALAEYYSQSSLLGYTDDGFCSEGLGYFNYGFDHYIILREEIIQATGGRIDLFDSPKMENIARYSLNFEVVNGAYPANADCRLGTGVAPHIVWYCNRSLGLGIEAYNDLPIRYGTPQGLGSLVPSMIYLFPNSASQRKAVRKNEPSTDMRRYYFDNAGMLICRPDSVTPTSMGVAFKGGHNAEHHNHNDVGSLSVIIGREMVMGDPGGPYHYAGAMWTDKRYDFRTIGSWGHPVPVVDGCLQSPGAKSAAKVLETSFSDHCDRFVLDLTEAYPSATKLKSLHRSFAYSRGELPKVTIEDRFQFEGEGGFESALTTTGTWSITDRGTIIIRGESQSIEVRIIAPPGVEYTISADQVQENGPLVRRVAITLCQPAVQGSLTLEITPINNR